MQKDTYFLLLLIFLFFDYISIVYNNIYFCQVSCRPDVENKPCRFIERRLHNQSRCVQTFSYTYALVRDGGSGGGHQFPGPAPLGGGGSWAMDYIQVRSGCRCALHAKTRHRHRHKQLAARSTPQLLNRLTQC